MTKKGTTHAGPTTALAAQTSTADAAAEKTTAQAGASATGSGAGAGAVVSAEAAKASSKPSEPDAHQGHGGHYRRVNGVRKLVHRTKGDDEAEPADKAGKADNKGDESAQAEPA